MPPPALVLFDLDGVLAHYDHAPRVAELARRTATRPDRVAAALFGSGLEAAADLGEFDSAGVVRELARRLGAPVSLDDCVAARAAAMRASGLVLALARAAAARAQVAILTNNGLMLRDHLHAICPPLLPLFEGRVFCSAQFGVAKPDPEVFLRCIEALEVRPGATLFFDDKPENVEGARRAGLLAYDYIDPPTLRRHLAAHDLLEPPHETP